VTVLGSRPAERGFVDAEAWWREVVQGREGEVGTRRDLRERRRDLRIVFEGQHAEDDLFGRDRGDQGNESSKT
jgi:hypothetical protein